MERVRTMKGNRRARMLAALLMIVLCMLPLAARAQHTLTLPLSSKTIETEAFCGTETIEEIVLPEGIERIERRAFADSAVTAAYLPASLAYIADDAFSGCNGVVVTVQAGTYAHTWAQGAELAMNVLPAPAGETAYRALLIGNTYPGEGNTELYGTDRDAYAMEAMLGYAGGTPYTATVAENLTADGMLSAIESAFAGADENDVSLFYYSGHGVSGTGVLVGVGNTYLNFAQLRAALDRVPGSKIVMLDSCFSGNAIGRSVGGDVKSQLRTFNNQAIMAFSAATKAAELASNPYYVLTAASSDQMSVTVGSGNDSGVVYFGLFTYCLLKGSGFDEINFTRMALEADSNGDGQIALDEAYRYVQTAVPEIEAMLDNCDQDVQVYPDNSAFVLWGR